MPLSMMVMASVMLVFCAIIQCFATLGFRRGIFFGVTVDPEFPQSESARQIVWRFRRPILVMAVVCNTALWIVVPRLSGIVAPLSVSGIIFLEVGTCIVSMARTTKYVRKFARPHSPVRTVSLTPQNRTLPGGYLLFAGPMILVGLGLFLLLTRKGLIPAETYRGALALLIVPLISNLSYLWVGWMATFRMRQIHSADRRMGYLFRLHMTYVMTVFWVYAGRQLEVGRHLLQPGGSGTRRGNPCRPIWLRPELRQQMVPGRRRRHSGDAVLYPAHLVLDLAKRFGFNF